jgi:hypothetical protein
MPILCTCKCVPKTIVSTKSCEISLTIKVKVLIVAEGDQCWPFLFFNQLNVLWDVV